MSSALRPLDPRAGSFDDDDVGVRLGLVARVRSWSAVRARSLTLLAVLLPLVGVLHGWNMDRSPGIGLNDDEGTYVSQAWALGAWHELAHYTYWYDHPPLGWIQIAGYAAVTGAWARAPYAVAVGREFMLVVDVVACGLLYVLARRLRVSRTAAAAGVVLFAASPLALHFHRMVWLDNVGTMWLLAALAIAASPRRSLAAALVSGACLAVAVLTKETLLVLAPVVLYVLWQHSDPRTRRYRLVGFATVAAALTSFYPLFALVKNEFFEGPGHVSLLWAIRWQLFLRESNGSIFTPDSAAWGSFHSWLDLDPWLLAVALLLAGPALAVRRLRPFALGLFLQAVMVARPGYLPQAFVVAVLPFAALLVVGMLHHAWGWGRLRRRRLGRAVAAVPLAGGAVALAAVWAPAVAAQLTRNEAVPMEQAVAWAKRHIGTDKGVLVDDNVWLDLVQAGFPARTPSPSVVWFYKVGTDPAVRMRSVDYFFYAMDPIYAARNLPEVAIPYERSVVVATFGSGENRITVRKIVHPGAPAAP